RRVAHEAVARAFASPAAKCDSAQPPASKRRWKGSRSPDEVAALAERLYAAICAQPGAGMVALAKEVGASVRELHHPMTRLKARGRIRSVGKRRLTRYFPMASG